MQPFLDHLAEFISAGQAKGEIREMAPRDGAAIVSALFTESLRLAIHDWPAP
jgi:hypothetical protein